MNLNERIGNFIELFSTLNKKFNNKWKKQKNNAFLKNPWFTEESIDFAIASYNSMVQYDTLTKWTSKYDIEATAKQKSVGVVMAGNIPLVGFHDFLSVLLSGHNIHIKLSSQDDILLPFLSEVLFYINHKWKSRITFVEKINHCDAIIATGSDNTARYFEYYFAKKPYIIRKNRTSIAIINGEENSGDWERLGQDIFTYFGLGCRNVSKIFIPSKFNCSEMIPHWESYRHLIEHNKYANNYYYQKAILNMNNSPHLDTGFAFLIPQKKLFAPISTIFVEEYQDKKNLDYLIGLHKKKIQCIVSKDGCNDNYFNFGKAQSPGIEDYPDNVDTMKFLTNL